ncbi:MAG TPA: hypothetical protein VHE30_11135 [Polyangiaceae bacterium]|nr:hypothetical protein [Polyangiaceae bacterium]
MTVRERDAVQLVAELLNRALRRGLDDPASEALGMAARQLTVWTRGRISAVDITLHVEELIAALVRVPRGAPVEAFELEHAKVREGR